MWMIEGASNKRFMSSWMFGNPMSLRFLDGDGGDGGEAAPDWHADFPSLANNPEASKLMSKYTDPDAAMAAAYDAQKKVGRSFWLPDDHSTLTDEQKTEIKANVAKMKGVPKTPEGYDVKVPEGSMVDQQAIAEFKTHCHAAGYSNDETQALVDFQLAFIDRINKTTNEAIGKRVKEAYDQFAKEQGGNDNANLRLEWVKRYLKSCAVDADGKTDEAMWNDFETRNFYNNQGKELILLRALAGPAQQFEATGGSPQGSVAMQAAKGALSYPEMGKKK